MGKIEQQVHKAQHRIWVNRWLRQWGWSLLFAAAAWTIAWSIDRLFFPGLLPQAWAALAGLAASLAVSLIWLALTRDTPQAAAAALDQAAGLRERVATSLHVDPQASDPFARAVIADAERAVAGLTAKKFVPLRWPRSLSFSSLMILAALLSLLLPEFDLLGRKEAQAAESDRLNTLKRTQAIIAKPISVMKQIEQRNPDLDLKKDKEADGDPLRRDRLSDPNVLRRETVKKLDRLQDALRQKANAERFKALSETKKRLKQLGQPSDPKSDLGKLMQSLSSGDFQAAQEATKKAQENLARRLRDGKIDAKTAEQMRKQLSEIASKLQEAAKDRQSQRELQNAGLSQDEAKRVLKALSKKDPKELEKLAKQLAKRLQQQGLSEQQIKKMLEKMQKRQQACSKCKGLGDKLGGAAKMLQQGNSQAAKGQLAEAGEMLSELEQLDQAYSELESQMAQLGDARDELGDKGSQRSPKCQQCGGTGFRADGAPCPSCKGSGL